MGLEADGRALKRVLEKRRRSLVLCYRYVERGLRMELVRMVEAHYAEYGRAPLAQFLENQRRDLRIAQTSLREVQAMDEGDLILTRTPEGIEQRLVTPILTEAMVAEYLDDSAEEGGETA